MIDWLLSAEPVPLWASLMIIIGGGILGYIIGYHFGGGKDKFR